MPFPSLIGRFLPTRIKSAVVGSFCQFHTSGPQHFHFMKKQIAIDPEIAKMRENRKRRKLINAIKMLKAYSKKPMPVEEMQLEPRHRQTLEQRKRREEGGQETQDENAVVMKKKILKQYAQSRAPLARLDIQWIKRSVEAQQKALEMLKQLSPALHEAAVQPDERLLFTQIQGPPVSPPISDYKSPDGEYQDATKQWEMPTLIELEKKFGVGRLIKMPEFKKKQLQLQQQQAQNAEEELSKKDPWITRTVTAANV